MISNHPATGQATQQSTTSSSASMRSVSQTTQGSRVTSVKPRSETVTSTRTTTVTWQTTTEAESEEEQQGKSETAEKPPCVEGELADSSQEKDTDGKVCQAQAQKLQ